ncbi:MAG TPA: hypothetical protein VK066_15780 [Chloroflexota bacterium]|nr:hypothetical protein [Chloroflexota bacterium]
MASDRAPSLRPLGVGDVLDESFAVYRRGFRTLVGIAAIVDIPLAIVSLGFVPLAVGMPRMYNVTSGTMPNFGPMMAPTIATLVVMVPLLTIGSILELSATCYATSVLYLGESPTVGGAYRQALGRFWRLVRLSLVFLGVFLGIGILSFLPVVVPPLLCISFPAAMVATAYLLVTWSLALPALVLEDLPGAIPALGRSRELVQGAWWRTFATLLLLAILLAVLQGLAAGLVSAIGGILGAVAAAGTGGPPIWVTVLNSLLGSVVNILITPIMYVGITVLYYDRRVRAEAYDLTILARDLGQQRPNAATP